MCLLNLINIARVWFDYSLYIDTLDMHKDKHPSLSPCIIAQSAESKENA